MAESDKHTSERQKRAIAREYAHALGDAIKGRGSWKYVQDIIIANADVPNWSPYVSLYKGEF